nr:hypothetical protein [uncultured Lacibacter sp.]
MFSFLSIHNYAEILALLTSIVCWRWIRSTFFKWLLLFLLFIVVVELTGKYFGVVLAKPNAWLYNFSVPAEYLFFTWLLSMHYRSKWFKQTARWFLAGFAVFALLQLFVWGELLKFNSIFLKLGSFAMIVFSCFYFIDFMREEVPLNPVKEPVFWIASGLFLFNTGEFLYVSLSDLLFSNWQTWKPVIRQINNNLIVLLYITIAIGIITMARKQWIQK